MKLRIGNKVISTRDLFKKEEIKSDGSAKKLLKKGIDEGWFEEFCGSSNNFSKGDIVLGMFGLIVYITVGRIVNPYLESYKFLYWILEPILMIALYILIKYDLLNYDEGMV